MAKSKVELLPETQGVPCCPPLAHAPLTEEEAVRAAAMFKALGDPIRLRLFSAVASHADGEACVCDISDVGVSQPTVSHHLKKLRETGLLTAERRGTWVYYRVAPGVLATLGNSFSVPAPRGRDGARRVTEPAGTSGATPARRTQGRRGPAPR